MTCKAWVLKGVLIEDTLTGKMYLCNQKVLVDVSPYRQCLIRLEEFISRIITANFRKSWPLNSFLHGRGSKVYRTLKEQILYPGGDGSFVL